MGEQGILGILPRHTTRQELLENLYTGVSWGRLGLAFLRRRVGSNQGIVVAVRVGSPLDTHSDSAMFLRVAALDFARAPIGRSAHTSCYRAHFHKKEQMMPLYVFRCSRCSDEIEEIRSVREIDDPPPHEPDVMCPETIVLDSDGYPDPKYAAEFKPCDYQRAPTVCAAVVWPHGTPSNEGRGGWTLQPGGAMVKVQRGREKTKYGEGA